MPRASYRSAATVLAERDEGMARMLAAAGPPVLRAARPSKFDALTRSICFQQLSGKAAATIYGRFAEAVGGVVSPEAVLATSVETLRGAGLSNAKTLAVIDLATKVASGDVPLEDVGRRSDEELITRLVAVHGIGRWTAEMFLMFQLRRLDVWPVDDLGVRNGYAQIYGLAEAPKAKDLVPLGDRFAPYRSVAAWYCWRAVEMTRITPA